MADITASPSDADVQHPPPVVQYVYLESDPARRSEMSSLLIASAAKVGTEPGCIKYRVSADMTKPGAFHLFEHWRTEEDLGRHESSPQTREMLGR
ncbi:putative quinol monooxygenase, partial [Nocardia aurea]|uniref:putative quinol monooxygenase n=1 Tax=Nocardia aurea TaxID=2144174 RepID=UPI000D691DA6